MSNDTTFEWRRVFHGRQVEATRAYLRSGFGKDVRFDPAHRRDRQVDVRSEGIDLPSMFIHQTRLDAGFVIAGRHPAPSYVMFLPLSGRIEANAYRSSIVCDPRRAFVISRPTAPVAVLRTEAPVSALVLRPTQAAVVRQLAALLGEQVDAPPELALGMDLAQGYGHSFARYLLLAVTDFKQSASIRTPIMIRELEDFLLSRLLMSHPHDYFAALRRASRSIAPRDVRRAIDFMQARLGSPIGVADIAEASGIAGRTLFKHFHDYRGISPMRYLREARFEKAREMLLRAQPEESVTEIAMAWGFGHMGRFSVEYRRRFGERPSDTLRRRR